MKNPPDNIVLIAAQNSANSIIVTDKEGLITWVNPSFPILTGYSLNEVIGQNPRIMKSSFHNKDFYKTMWETISSGKKWKGLMVNKNKDGSHYRAMTTITPVISPDGTIDSYVGIQEDASVFERICDDLAWCEKKFSMVFDVAEVPQLVLSPDGDFLKVNRAAEELLGFSRIELMNMNFIDITNPDDREKSIKKLKEVIDNPEIERYSIEKRYIGKNNEVIAAQICCSIARDTSGKCVFLIVQIKDLTKEKSLLQQVQNFSDSLKAANQIFKVVSEISQFTINQEIFNLNDVLQIAGERLEMSSVFVQNCQETTDIDKLWTSSRVEDSEIEMMKDNCSISGISKWVSLGGTFIGKIKNSPEELHHLRFIKCIENSLQVYVLPILIKQRPWGIIGFANGNGHSWSEAEKEALLSLSRLIAVMIENNWEKAKLINHISFRFEELESVIDGNQVETKEAL